MIVWPTRSRTGSQFVLQLTTKLLGAGRLEPQARINGARKDTHRAELRSGTFAVESGIDYLKDNGIKSLKYEDPGKDDFILEVAKAFPEAKFVASYRALALAIMSHHNLVWGHNEADVLYQFSASYSLYDDLYQQGRLLMVDVMWPAAFSTEKFCAFFGVDGNRRFEEFVAEWKPVNTLTDQKNRVGDLSPATLPPRFDRLWDIHPWVGPLELKYISICKETSQL